MAQVLIRDLDPKVVATLKKSARENGRSLEAELRLILEDEARRRSVDFWRLAAELRARFADRQWSDSVDLIREDRER
jgi:plasmid stability protein